MTDILSRRLLRVLDMLPPRFSSELRRVAGTQQDFERRLCEIRLRAGHVSSVTLPEGNLTIPVVLTRDEMAECLKRFCRGSVYAHSDSLREGYVDLGDGFRAGVAGRAVEEAGRLCGVGEVTSVCIRVPHRVPGAGRAAVEAFEKNGMSRGVLVYSPPGGGKTTALRDLICTLSSPPYSLRISVIDSRGELSGDWLSAVCLVDVLTGYEKAAGIEIATRTLSPQALVCDELGDSDEAEAVLAVQGCGVPLIASAHGGSISEVMSRPSVRMLAECGIFGAFVGIYRTGDKYICKTDYRQYGREGEGI